VAVGAAPLDTHIRHDCRTRLSDSAWFCAYLRCDVAYFNLFEVVVTIDELNGPVYPKHPQAAICPCFGFSLDDVEADVRDGAPTRIRRLLEQSRSPDARCATLAPDGKCCLREVQRLFMKLRAEE
jgi:hypothetical protein